MPGALAKVASKIAGTTNAVKAFHRMSCVARQKGWRKTVRDEDKLCLQEELWKLSIFANCGEEFYKALSDQMSMKAFEPGQTIIESGSPGSQLLIIRKGSAQMSVEGLDVAKIESGSYFGEMYLLGIENIWNVTLRAENLCVVAEISREDFTKVLEDFSRS